jgi:hypothetical protein
VVVNENDMNTFVKDFTRYCNFFETLDTNIILSPVAIYAIYDVLRKNQDIEYEDKLRTHLIKLSNNETKAQRSMWETRIVNSDTGKKYSADETRNKLNKYFHEFTEKLLNINNFDNEEPIKVAAPRKPIPPKVRSLVWKNQFNDDDIGKCFCCNTDIYKKAKDRKKTWNCGHIVSHYNGGEDTVNNMKCICFGCNQAMKTTNLLEWKARIHPEVVPKTEEHFTDLNIDEPDLNIDELKVLAEKYKKQQDRVKAYHKQHSEKTNENVKKIL